MKMVKPRPANKGQPETMVVEDTDEDESLDVMYNANEERSAKKIKKESAGDDLMRSKGRSMSVKGEIQYEDGEVSKAGNRAEGGKGRQIVVVKGKKTMVGVKEGKKSSGNGRMMQQCLRIRSPPICLFLVVKIFSYA